MGKAQFGARVGLMAPGQGFYTFPFRIFRHARWESKSSQ
jgi:hypothetical protein